MLFAALYCRWFNAFADEDESEEDPAARLRRRLWQLIALFLVGNGVNGALAYLVYVKKGDDWPLMIVGAFFLSGVIVLGHRVARSFLLIRAYYRAKALQQKLTEAAEKKRREQSGGK